MEAPCIWNESSNEKEKKKKHFFILTLNEFKQLEDIKIEPLKNISFHFNNK